MQLETMNTECKKHTEVEKHMLPHVYRLVSILKKHKAGTNVQDPLKFLFFNAVFFSILFAFHQHPTTLYNYSDSMNKLLYIKVEILLCQRNSLFSI